MHYVMDVCDHVQSIILLPHIVGTSFLIVVLTKLNASEQALTSHFCGEKQSNIVVLLLNHIIFNFFTYDVSEILVCS